MKAGKYYIGDPCYVLDEPAFDWGEVLDDTNFFGLYASANNRKNDKYAPKEYQFGEFIIYNSDGDVVEVCGSSTAHGDGEYKDEDDNSYGVDAGLIGAVPYDAIPEEGLIEKYGKYHGETKEEILNSLGHVHEFDREFTVRYEDGKIIFAGSMFGNSVKIDTDPDEEDDAEICPNCGEYWYACTCDDEEDDY